MEGRYYAEGATRHHSRDTCPAGQTIPEDDRIPDMGDLPDREACQEVKQGEASRRQTIYNRKRLRGGE
jgi:hypothetical protein